MDLEFFERQKRHSARPQSQIQPVERRSSKMSSPTRDARTYREGFQDRTIRAVTPESGSESSARDVRDIKFAGSTTASPSSISRKGLTSPNREPSTSISSVRDDHPVRAKPRRQKPDRKSSGELPLSSSPTSLLSKTRVRLNSITTSNPFSARPSDDASNSIGFPSIIPSPTLQHQEVKTQRPVRKPQRLVKPAPSNGSPEQGRCAQDMDVRSPPMNSDSSTILQLMKTTYGRMHGLLSFRAANVKTWTSGYCAINVASGSLIYQAQGESVSAKTLIPDLRGCRVRSLYDAEHECNYLSVSTASSGLRIHLKPPVPETFDSWLAALLCWQPIRPKGIQNKMTKPQSISILERRTKDKRRASDASMSSNPAIIKVGKMLLWEGTTDTDASHSTSPKRISTYKQLRAISPAWQRVSCTLLENGQFKLLTESDAQTISSIRLSSLSRCAVQQVNPSVLEDEFCLAIYPQYVAQPKDEIQSKPIYLSLESRVLFEVWFVLLWAFTVPELYGPEEPLREAPTYQREQVQSPKLSSRQGMFRVERSLSIKITEAKLSSRSSPDGSRDKIFTSTSLASAGLAGEFYAEVLLDLEPRGRTSAKPHNSMFWSEEFTFGDLPPVLSSALVLIKVRNPDQKEWTTVTTAAYSLSYGDNNPLTVNGEIEVSSHDAVFGKVELQLDDMERGLDTEKRWPILDTSDTPIGEALMKLRLTETTVLMKEDYSPLLDLLRNFSNGLTVTLSKAIPTELKSISEIFLDIFQVCGDASGWITTLVEDEIDGVHHEATANRLRYNSRLQSNESYESAEDRELVVRDLGRSATIEANLLFRGNTLLTKALDAHMRRLGKEYLEETIGERLRDIDESNPDCEVDPSRVKPGQDLNRNWGNLITLTMNLWSAISSSASRCPTELRQLFRHIKSCAETRYGDFLRTVAYSSVSGFLFLRFFCPAILNPKLFGLLKGKNAPVSLPGAIVC
jgi:GTPase-activator protein for Ras-like GTPase